MPADLSPRSFVRALLGGAVAERVGDRLMLPDGRTIAVALLAPAFESGALSEDGRACRTTLQARAWLKRTQLDEDAQAARRQVVTVDERLVNAAESPLARLAIGKSPFLEPHHVEAGERVRRLVERAQLRSRVTMTYSASRVAGSPHHKNDISDMAVDARRAVAEIHRVLPADCSGVVLDVCGFLKGLQEVEWERGWPRRSAKLVLRIGLEQLALHYGLYAVAVGKARAGGHAWLPDGARPSSWD
jgi:hypothetical protein